MKPVDGEGKDQTDDEKELSDETMAKQ